MMTLQTHACPSSIYLLEGKPEMVQRIKTAITIWLSCQ